MKNFLLRRWTTMAALAGLGMLSPACSLDKEPFYEKTPTQIFSNFENYPGLLAKVYAGLATSGQTGPSGSGDLKGLDEGFGQYTRALYNCQELTTDEAVVAWNNDAGLIDMHYMTWNAGNQFPRSMYNRIFYQIALCNEFLRQTTDSKLSTNGINGANAELTKKYRAEARLLRALSYWHAIDMFGNVPFVTENDEVSGAFKPRQGSRSELFNYVESELLDLGADNNPLLPDAHTAEYGRADKGLAWMILAKLYLNAQVYIDQPKNTECLTYCKKLIAANYRLSPNTSATQVDGYRKLFLADNNTSPETIFAVPFDGLNTQTYGGTTFLINGSLGGSIGGQQALRVFGTQGTWAGLRTTKQLINKFPDTTQAGPDKRFLFHSLRQTLEIGAVTTFTQGYMFKKWRNVTSTGAAGSNATNSFADTDLPLFRLADVYLMYAEAVLRGGAGGNPTDALSYVNAVRQRAYGNASGNISSSQLTLDFLLDERARELYSECHRRTDLIRFGKFTSNYNWAWKGNVAAGQNVESFRALYPLPNADLAVNPNLLQNTGY